MMRRRSSMAAAVVGAAVLVACTSAVADQSATPAERIHAVNGRPGDPGAPSLDVFTFCNHGNRVYVTSSSNGGVAMTVVPGPTVGC